VKEGEEEEEEEKKSKNPPPSPRRFHAAAASDVVFPYMTIKLYPEISLFSSSIIVVVTYPS
jgi:hypothetical protein